eukprot:CAMPEP_0176140942 /NCGR_PEP_ID=MMETSP0120_2-20121206/71659_1 /TAXON_ID=160619 /ORGANISM="Kryptoperidinium foliaceum, Strain CCMP 1326" /LENGTH=38 /DNA_ID= /DNA_START= /DNA_END= /DNA_ORIENTATION=
MCAWKAAPLASGQGVLDARHVRLSPCPQCPLLNMAYLA